MSREVDEALIAIKVALKAIEAALRGNKPAPDQAPVIEALRGALMGTGSLDTSLPAEFSAMLKDLAAAAAIRDRTGIDLEAWRPDGRCQ